MKQYCTQWLRTGIAWGVLGLTLLIGLSTGITMTGCKKARLFTNLDSIPEVPSQFHFFNTFDYGDSLALSIDGLTRENVKQYRFSSYYPSSSAFNLNNAQPNSKQIKIFDPVLQTKFANRPDNSTFQFLPNTSYIVFVNYNAFDTTYAPKNTIVPQLMFFPEDVYHPFAGTTGIRFFNCLAAPSTADLTVTPNVGQGTSVTLQPLGYQGAQPVRIGDSYTTSQQGQKRVTLHISRGFGADAYLTFLPFELLDGKNYSFFAVGDMTNFLFGKQPRPRVFVVEDGVPASLRELDFSNLRYSSLAGTQVTVINGAFNVPGLLETSAGNFFGLDVQLNQTKVKVVRWPTNQLSQEDIGLGWNGQFPGGTTSTLQRIATSPVIPDGPYVCNVTPSGTFAPVYDQFSYNFELGMSYTLCLLPDLQSAVKAGHLVLENDLSPDPKLFKLRFVNIMGGAGLVDVHTGSPSGPVIASSIAYGTATDYISFKADLSTQQLYVTAAGSTTPLFQTGTDNGPLLLPFTGGNSGTIYLMGLLPGTSYNGDPGYFKPYVYFNSDAYLDFRTRLNSSQLYFQL